MINCYLNKTFIDYPYSEVLPVINLGAMEDNAVFTDNNNVVSSDNE